MKTLIQLADALQITLAEAFQFQKPKTRTKSKSNPEKDRAIIALNRVMTKRSVKDIRMFTAIARRLR